MGIYYFVCIVEQGPDQVFCSRVRSTTNATEEAMLKFCDKFVLWVKMSAVLESNCAE